MRFILAVVSLCLMTGKGWSADITLSTNGPAITEGADMVVDCTSAGPAVNRLIVVDLAFSGAGTTAEDGYDAPPISDYTCLIAANQLSGSVNIPTTADRVIESSEQYAIVGTPRTAAADTVTGTASFTIDDDGNGAGVTIRPTGDWFATTEGSDLLVNVEYVDDANNVVPIEADYTLGFSFIDETAIGAEANTFSVTEDYDNTPPAAPNIIGSTNGVATLSYDVPIATFDNDHPENVERFWVSLDDTASDPDIAVDNSVFIEAYIYDNDKPSLYVINPFSAIPLRYKGDIRQLVFTQNPNDGIQWSSGPLNARIVEINRLRNYRNGIDFRVQPPRRNPRDRFVEYLFTTTETINGIPYPMAAFSHVSATTNDGKFRAPINVNHPTVITAYPATADRRERNLEEPVTISVRGTDPAMMRSLKWTFYGANRRKRNLKNSFGMRSITLTSTADEGLYVISRRNGQQKGFVQYVRVLLSSCPKGRFNEAGLCDGGPIHCMHGGVVDPRFSAGICTCPPGFVGPTCQYPLGRAEFGTNGQFNLLDILGSRGIGVTFSLPLPFGTTCLPGFWGVGCSRKCPSGRYGPSCLWICHCRGRCSETGICSNGCVEGFIGPTCQETI